MFGCMVRKVRVNPGDPEWHDKSLSPPRHFTCEHCGEEGLTGEADARCDECGRVTRLSYEELRDEDGNPV